MNTSDNIVTVPIAAERLGVIPARVHAMIRAGVLVARKVGRDWHIDGASLAAELARRESRPEILRGGRPAHRG